MTIPENRFGEIKGCILWDSAQEDIDESIGWTKVWRIGWDDEEGKPWHFLLPDIFKNAQALYELYRKLHPEWKLRRIIREYAPIFVLNRGYWL